METGRFWVTPVSGRLLHSNNHLRWNKQGGREGKTTDSCLIDPQDRTLSLFMACGYPECSVGSFTVAWAAVDDYWRGCTALFILKPQLCSPPFPPLLRRQVCVSMHTFKSGQPTQFSEVRGKAFVFFSSLDDSVLFLHQQPAPQSCVVQASVPPCKAAGLYRPGAGLGPGRLLPAFPCQPAGPCMRVPDLDEVENVHLKDDSATIESLSNRPCKVCASNLFLGHIHMRPPVCNAQTAVLVAIRLRLILNHSHTLVIV